MTIYVESNLVLEVALDQEEASFANGVLVAAEVGRINLAIPAASLVEPFTTVAHRGRARDRTARELDQQVRELGRSSARRSNLVDLIAVTSTLRSIEGIETRQVVEVVSRIARIARVIPVDASVLATSEVLRVRQGLSSIDAQILASVLSDLSLSSPDQAHIFVSKNWRDFRSSGIEADLAVLGCRYLGSFKEARPFLPDDTIRR